jgi:hypothetical protein
MEQEGYEPNNRQCRYDQRNAPLHEHEEQEHNDQNASDNCSTGIGKV